MVDNSKYWEPESDESTPPPKKSEPEMRVKIGGVSEAQPKTKEPGSGSPASGIEKVFPAIGQPVEDFDKFSGDLRITEIQLPAVKDMADGEEVKLVVTAVKVRGEFEQDTEYREGISKRIATSNPYLSAKFEIISIEQMEADPEGGSPADGEPGTKKVKIESE